VTDVSRHLSRYSWAKLIARVFETDPLLCGHCGGRMKLIAFMAHASEIRQTLARVGLPSETPKFQTRVNVFTRMAIPYDVSSTEGRSRC
jgi:hypothetical protein